MLRLKQILGLTTARATQLVVHPTMPHLVAYPAGCTVVLYDYVAGRQLRFLCGDLTRDGPLRTVGLTSLPGSPSPSQPSSFASPIGSLGGLGPVDHSQFFTDAQSPTPPRPTVPKPVACLAFSTDGQYLAVGETGPRPRVLVWDWQQQILLAELESHRFGVVAVLFSPDSRYLVTVGKPHDGFLHVWDWPREIRVASNRITTRVCNIAYAPDGTFFVTVGVRHVKFWYLRPIPDSDRAIETIDVLEGRAGLLGQWRNSTFVGVAVLNQMISPEMYQTTVPVQPQRVNGTDTSGQPTTPLVFALTSSGILCLFSMAQRTLQKWVDTRITKALALDVNEKYVICGGKGGLVRLFDPTDLSYRGTLPLLHPYPTPSQTGFWRSNAEHQEESLPSKSPCDNSTSTVCPAGVVAARLCAYNVRWLHQGRYHVVCVYQDRRLVVWNLDLDLTVAQDRGPIHQLVFPSGSLGGLVSPPTHVDASNDTLLTFGDDGVVKWWPMSEAALETRMVANTPAAVMLMASLSSQNMELQPVLLPGKEEGQGLSALCVSPDGRFLAVGNKAGCVWLYDVEIQTYIMNCQVHSAAILTMDFTVLSPTERVGSMGMNEYLLATAGRDRLIHIFHLYLEQDLPSPVVSQIPASGHYRCQHLQTLDDHSSSITCVRFFGKGLRVVSCGLDKSVMFRCRARATGNRFPPFTLQQQYCNRSTISDLALDPTRNLVIAVTVDRTILVFDATLGKLARSYRPESREGGSPRPPVSGGDSRGSPRLVTNSPTLPFAKTIPLRSSETVPPRRRSLTPGGLFQGKQPSPSLLSPATGAVDYGYTGVALSARHTLAAVVGSDKGVRLLDRTTSQWKQTVYGPSEPITGVTFLGSTGTHLAVSASDGCIYVWTRSSEVDITSGECLDFSAEEVNQDYSNGSYDVPIRWEPPPADDSGLYPVVSLSAPYGPPAKRALRRVVSETRVLTPSSPLAHNASIRPPLSGDQYSATPQSRRTLSSDNETEGTDWSDRSTLSVSGGRPASSSPVLDGPRTLRRSSSSLLTQFHRTRLDSSTLPNPHALGRERLEKSENPNVLALLQSVIPTLYQARTWLNQSTPSSLSPDTRAALLETSLSLQTEIAALHHCLTNSAMDNPSTVTNVTNTCESPLWGQHLEKYSDQLVALVATKLRLLE
ncbi:hypothetical protein IWQ61_003792 [Dispira simplex]|nr:hypothetical protein IWQ61_003792 [Dispira simplex]